LLTALPPLAPDLGVWTTVKLARDCHVQFERAYYSAPFGLIGKRLWLRATDTVVALYEDFRLVATHPRSRRPGERRTVREHLPPEAQAFFARDRDWCVARAAAVGERCAELVTHLLADRIVERLRAAQALLRLAERYGTSRLEAACARALAHGSPFYRTVKTILAGGHDQQPVPLHETGPAYAGGARFARDAGSLFAEAPTLH
jgi:hypothetical protein